MQLYRIDTERGQDFCRFDCIRIIVPRKVQNHMHSRFKASFLNPEDGIYKLGKSMPTIYFFESVIIDGLQAKLD